MTQSSNVPNATPNAGSSRRRFRQVLFRVHTWLGLHSCLIMAFLFITGTLSLLAPEMDVGARPNLYIAPASVQGEGASYGALYETASEALPEAAVATIWGPKRPWFGHMVETKATAGKDQVVWLHPKTGEVMGVSRPDPFGIKEVILRLHDTFMIPLNEVHIALMFFSLLLIVSIITGLVTYRRFWKGLFRLPSKGSNQRNRHGAWHRLLAVWSLPFLIIVAISSLVFLINGLGLKPTYGPVAQTPEREIVLPATFGGETIDRLIGNIQAEMPTFEPGVVRLPQTKYRPIIISGYETIRPELWGTTTVHFDPISETVLGIRRAHSDSTMAWIIALALSFHFGEFAGVWSVVLWLVFGVVSTLLLLTGARIYAARSLSDRDGAAALDGRGTFGILWQGMGVFRWLYLLGALAILASTVLQAVL